MMLQFSCYKGFCMDKWSVECGGARPGWAGLQACCSSGSLTIRRSWGKWRSHGVWGEGGRPVPRRPPAAPRTRPHHTRAVSSQSQWCLSGHSARPSCPCRPAPQSPAPLPIRYRFSLGSTGPLRYVPVPERTHPADFFREDVFLIRYNIMFSFGDLRATATGTTFSFEAPRFWLFKKSAAHLWS